MKRMLVLLLVAALLLCGPALAETRERVILLEGMEETIHETRFDTGLGFAFWYDDERMEVDADMSEDGLGVIVRPIESDQAVYMELMSSDSIGMTAPEYLQLNAPGAESYDRFETERGEEIVGWSGPAAFNDDFAQGFYVVQSGKDIVAVATTWPMEYEEGWGRRLLAVLSTVEFVDEEEEGWE